MSFPGSNHYVDEAARSLGVGLPGVNVARGQRAVSQVGTLVGQVAGRPEALTDDFRRGLAELVDGLKVAATAAEMMQAEVFPPPPTRKDKDRS